MPAPLVTAVLGTSPKQVFDLTAGAGEWGTDFAADADNTAGVVVGTSSQAVTDAVAALASPAAGTVLRNVWLLKKGEAPLSLPGRAALAGGVTALWAAAVSGTQILKGQSW